MGDGQQVNGRAKTIVAVTAVLSALAILAVVARFVSVRIKRTPFRLDDWLILVALIVTLGVTINNIVGVAIAGMGENEYYRTDVPDFPTPKELLPQGQIMFAMQILHTCSMPLIKASVLVFYCRMFSAIPSMKIAATCVGVFVCCWWVSILFASVFQCWPISDNWGTQPSQLSGCPPNILIMYQTAAFTNMMTDVVILCLPIPPMLKLQMRRQRKLLVSLALLTGAIVVVAGIGRTVVYFRFIYLADYNFSYHYYHLIMWTSAEPALGIIGACLPTIRPIFRGFSPESVIASVRSMISLRSRPSTTNTPRGSKDGPTDEEDKAALHAPADASGKKKTKDPYGMDSLMQTTTSLEPGVPGLVQVGDHEASWENADRIEGEETAREEYELQPRVGCPHKVDTECNGAMAAGNDNRV